MRSDPVTVARRIVAIFGPTGSGKTGVAVSLADRLAGVGETTVAINCDSMQVYRGMEVLSGAPTVDERQRLEHRLVGFRSPTEEFSAGEFGSLARVEVDRALEEGRRPILVGGTGLYMRAALVDLDFGPVIPDPVREEIEREMDASGPEALHRRLPDEVSGWVTPTDRKRIARYLGLAAIGVRPAPPTTKGGLLWDAPLRHPTLAVGLVLEREVLRRRIIARVEAMVEGGAVEEARTILLSGPSRTAEKAIGLHEFAEEDLDAVVRGHLKLARRQMTWLRRTPGLTVVDRTSLDDQGVAELIFGELESPADRNA
ncbi:MAG: tRNA (adenosine(37)-N6)-dimethylallyltransferase [Solirubrobacterales bacterium]